MARKYWFQVRHGFNYRCGAEWDVYYVKAYNAERAKELVEPCLDSNKKGEKIEVKQAPEDWWYLEQYENGVYLVDHDYWSR